VARDTDRCVRLVGAGLRRRGFVGREPHQSRQDPEGGTCAVYLQRWRHQFTMNLNYIPERLFVAWSSVGHGNVNALTSGGVNIGFSCRLARLAGREPWDGDADWVAPASSDEVEPVAEVTLRAFDDYAEPWFERLSHPEQALSMIPDPTTPEGLEIAAALLVGEPSSPETELVIGQIEARIAELDPSRRPIEFWQERPAWWLALVKQDLSLFNWLHQQLRPAD
jgi:hypothetical protein